jgi:hypothetical protein
MLIGESSVNEKAGLSERVRKLNTTYRSSSPSKLLVRLHAHQAIGLVKGGVGGGHVTPVEVRASYSIVVIQAALRTTSTSRSTIFPCHFRSRSVSG